MAHACFMISVIAGNTQDRLPLSKYEPGCASHWNCSVHPVGSPGFRRRLSSNFRSMFTTKRYPVEPRPDCLWTLPVVLSSISFGKGDSWPSTVAVTSACTHSATDCSASAGELDAAMLGWKVHIDEINPLHVWVQLDSRALYSTAEDLSGIDHDIMTAED